MSQLLRGMVWRKGQAITLFLLGTVVVAGCLVAAQFSDLTDTPAGSVGILLLLGVVALSVQAAASARSRRPEIALAQIRGRQGLRLFVYFLTEPVTILLLATAAGVLVGRFVTRIAADRWLDTSGQDAQRIGTLGWVTVGVALAASLAAVLGGSWRTVREPLVEQIDGSRRPRPAPTLVLFGQTLVIVAAGIAGFQASQQAGSRDGWAGIVNPALLSPVLLGLAAGQVAAWGLQAGASVASRRAGDPRAIGRFLAVRRMARRSDTVFGTRLVIAAAVVTAVTASATTAVQAWQDEATRLSLGGPRQFSVDEGALAAYNASRAADPDGRWLMAMVGVPDGSEPYRRVFADTSRWDAVVGGFLGGTGADGVSGQLDSLQTGTPVQPLSGSSVSATFTNASVLATYNAGLRVTYTRGDGSVQVVGLQPDRPASAEGTTTVTRALHGCDAGCTVSLLSIDGTQLPRLNVPGQPTAHGGPPFVVVTDATFAGTPLLAKRVWTSVQDSRSGQDGGSLRVRVSPRGDPIDFEPDETAQDLSVVATPGLDLGSSRGNAIVYAVDGSEHPADVVGQVDALPFVGRQGALLDLARAFGSGSTIATAQAYVVARANTPASVLDKLDATGATGAERDFGTSLDRAQRRADVQGVRLYTLMSIFAALIALVGLAAAVSGQRPERRREAASLRVTGVRSRHIRAAHRREALWLAVGAAVAVAVTGWVASRLTLEGLSLVPQTAYSPLLQADPRWSTVIPVALGAGVAVGMVTLFANRRIARTSPPSLLRDDAR